MVLVDANVLVYAYREDAPEHEGHRRWLDGVLNADAPFGVADSVLASFLRIVTHPAVFKPPSPMPSALEFAEAVREAPNAVRIAPGERHWTIFTGLCRSTGVKGNLVPDAFLAALAIESGCEWVTTDRDFSRFPGLHWRHPLSQSRGRG
jgi:hypothetical protein